MTSPREPKQPCVLLTRTPVHPPMMGEAQVEGRLSLGTLEPVGTSGLRSRSLWLLSAPLEGWVRPPRDRAGRRVDRAVTNTRTAQPGPPEAR